MTFIKFFLICLFFLCGSVPSYSTSPLFEVKEVISLLETQHLNWLGSQKNKLTNASEFEFVLRRNSGYTPPKELYDVELKEYTYSPSTKHFRTKLAFLARDEERTELLSYPLEGFIYPLIMVPTLKTGLTSNQAIKANNIEFLSLREERIQPYIEQNPELLIGMEVTTSIPAHKPISKHYLKSPRVIQKGEFVTLIINDGFIQLSAQGKALKPGGKGELITVMNNSSKKIIQGTVIGPGQVRINTQGRM